MRAAAFFVFLLPIVQWCLFQDSLRLQLFGVASFASHIFSFGWPWTFVAYRCNTLSFISAVRP